MGIESLGGRRKNHQRGERCPRRPPRTQPQVHYHFATVEDVQRDIERGLFLEHACVHGNYYGTSKKAVEVVQQAGKICILDIDVQGVRSARRPRA